MDNIKHNHKAHNESAATMGHTLHDAPKIKRSNFSLAVSATIHCLIGCGIGEVLGMIISSSFGLSTLYSILLSIILGFFGGLLLGILPLRKIGFSYKQALRTVIIGEGLSIVVMEAFELIIQVAVPGVMEAHLTDSIFWLGMFLSLIVGFLAALPINYIMVKSGIRHIH